MAELAVIVCRLVQYSAASVLMGSALFFVYALPSRGAPSAASLRWPRPLLTVAAFLLLVTSVLGLLARTAILAGSWADGLTAEALTAVVSQMDLGKAAVARAVAALLALPCLVFLRPGRAQWLGTGAFGALACATFGWMGHGAATDGGGHLPHLAADILHALVAALWIGALVAFVGLLIPRRQGSERLSAIVRALQRFSPLGMALVATLAVTGLINAWYLVGTDLGAALQEPYGQLLALKLALFAAMLALAALHRQRTVPALAGHLSSRAPAEGDALASLRRSVMAEALLGFAVLALVAWFGTLPPPGSM
jgi:putative copper resistance protein D